ncbi:MULTISPECIES: hypothetical protein [Streptomycetaceae]|uniref:DUF2933 domain-containing protein n=1 Tax=Streptantibioticus cattleyicolor (strain ATCC 35852 / DSM 46488 / JCM 4925 / NBRC 14057 / NRRL 8057) TaxID=1003195 RepID=F8K4G1_STREN|nr:MULTISPECIES: hypothetical protein [Streptomycetaceae]AEW95115.1 hypothetical protein SCATT_27440 [Streptantibioticus cattleyicolor NRRL 8057 = DSM 46488]MYS59704.1 hypothetical protein [Streptomyces sp. SID5468]CCB75462.1 exported protein of unknown function [Streptantibioticus cattleyicolor NRRL 8057 = DSM 46488]
MQQLLYILPALMCPLGMGAMMWFMMRGNKQQPAQSNTTAQEQELARLRNEIAAIRGSQTSEAAEPTSVPLDKHHQANR